LHHITTIAVVTPDFEEAFRASNSWTLRLP